jgi:hypothetical protein
MFYMGFTVRLGWEECVVCCALVLSFCLSVWSLRWGLRRAGIPFCLDLLLCAAVGVVWGGWCRWAPDYPPRCAACARWVVSPGIETP